MAADEGHAIDELAVRDLPGKLAMIVFAGATLALGWEVWGIPFHFGFFPLPLEPSISATSSASPCSRSAGSESSSACWRSAAAAIPLADARRPAAEQLRANSYSERVLWPVSAKAVVVRDGTVLLARNDRDEWELPGGRVERGEAPSAAAVREVAEETGLLVQTTSNLGSAPFEVTPNRFVMIAAFACSIVEERELLVSEEHTALAWQPLGRLDQLALPSVYRDFIERAVRGRIVLMGDSHLAKLDRAQLRRLGAMTGLSPLIVNQAVGGSSVLDLLAEIEVDALLPGDQIVISVGTNDSAPWKRVPLDQFRSALGELLDRLQAHRPVILVPPPVDEARQAESGRLHRRTEEERLRYAAVVEAAAGAHRARVVDVSGEHLHAADGVHLSSAGYDLLIARLAQALDHRAEPR